MNNDIDRLQGLWNFESLELDGIAVPAAMLATSTIAIAGDAFVTRSAGATYEGTFVVDESAQPKAIDMHFTGGPEKGNKSLGIYELTGDRWRVCLGLTGRPRPSGFFTTPGSGHAFEILVRSTDQ